MSGLHSLLPVPSWDEPDAEGSDFPPPPVPEDEPDGDWDTGDGEWIFDPCALFLSLSYMLIIALATLQLWMILSSEHRLTTFQTGLLSLSVLFAAVRLVFWIKTMYTSNWDYAVTLFVFLFPIVLQFATFSLLVVYYVQVINKTQWKKKYRRIYTTAYLATNLFFVLIVLMLCIMQIRKFQEALPKGFSSAVDDAYLAYLGLLDVLLASMLVKYGRLFNKHTQFSKQLLPRSRKTFMLLNAFLVFIFYFRALYAFANLMDLLPARQSVVKNEHDPVFIGVLVFYFITECLPALTVIGLIWRVPEKQARSFSQNGGTFAPRGGTRTFRAKDLEEDAVEEMSEAGLLDPEEAGEYQSSGGSSAAQPVGGLVQPLLSDKTVFNDLGRYDSPPGDPSVMRGSQTTDKFDKFVVGSNTSSNDPKSFNQLQAAFGGDTISPYDILTNYTNKNRRGSTRRATLTQTGSSAGSGGAGGGGGAGGSGRSLGASAPRDLGSHRGSGEFARPSSLGGQGTGLSSVGRGGSDKNLGSSVGGGGRIEE